MLINKNESIPEEFFVFVNFSSPLAANNFNVGAYTSGACSTWLQAIILAGQCPCHVTLQIGNFSAYQMTTRDFMKMSHLFMPFS